MGADQLRRVVGRAVVDDDDLQIRIVARQDVAHRFDNDPAFIMGRNEHGL
jgi:hypothetical protein